MTLKLLIFESIFEALSLNMNYGCLIILLFWNDLFLFYLISIKISSFLRFGINMGFKKAVFDFFEFKRLRLFFWFFVENFLSFETDFGVKIFIHTLQSTNLVFLVPLGQRNQKVFMPNSCLWNKLRNCAWFFRIFAFENSANGAALMIIQWEIRRIYDGLDISAVDYREGKMACFWFSKRKKIASFWFYEEEKLFSSVRKWFSAFFWLNSLNFSEKNFHELKHLLQINSRTQRWRMKPKIRFSGRLLHLVGKNWLFSSWDLGTRVFVLYLGFIIVFFKEIQWECHFQPQSLGFLQLFERRIN